MKKLASFLIICSSFSFAQKTKSLKLKKFKVAYLSDTLRETSGLTLMNGNLYSFNDGGNASEIYEINPKNGEITNIQKVEFTNKDWEAITNDGQSIYIGDIGNNRGNRKDLAVYKVNGYSTEKIPFEYENQTEFNPKKDLHDFDAEALIFKDGNLHLFSKEWLSKKTARYIIDPTKAELQKIKKIEEFPANFLVTDASYFNQKLYLVGYNKRAGAYMLVFDEDEKGNFFSSKYTKYRLGSVLKYGQIEGITVNENGIFISGEAFKKLGFNVKQSLYFIPHNKL